MKVSIPTAYPPVAFWAILIVNELEPVGGLAIVKWLTASVRVKLNVCDWERSKVTTLEELETVWTSSTYVFSLVKPSTSSFALGASVPIPTFTPLVVIVVPPVPTDKVVVVTIPAVIFPVADCKSNPVAVSIPLTTTLFAVIMPTNTDCPFT